MEDGPLRPPPGINPAVNRPPAGPRVPPAFYQPPEKKKRGCCRECCCCACIIILILIILIVIICGLFYALVQPKVPQFKFKPVEMDKFDIKPKEDGTAIANCKAIVRVEINNPNSKIKIYFGETDVKLTADKETKLGNGNVPAFVQPENNVTLLQFSLGVDNEPLDLPTAASLVPRLKDGQIEVDAVVKTSLGIGVVGLKIGMIVITIKCGGNMQQLKDGSTPKCTFSALGFDYKT